MHRINNYKKHNGEDITENGITLIALIITIVLMLILATVVVTGAINGGLFGYAKKAKDNTEIASEKEGIEKSYIIAQGTSKYGTVSETEFQKAIDKVMGENQAEVMANGDEFVIKIGEKYYQIDKKGKISDPKELTPIENAGDITKKGTGTESNPYKIECIEDLVDFSNQVQNNATMFRNAYVILTKTLDFKSIFSYSNYKAKYRYDETLNAYVPDENSQTTIQELCTTDKGFIPIGLDYNSGKNFKGIFDGQGKEIQNIYIYTSNNAGLFGASSNATIKNIGVTGNITSTGSAAAGIHVDGYGTQIFNCYNKATITSTTGSAAGINAHRSPTVKGCYNEGNIKAYGVAAGITTAFSGTVDRCYNLGNVTSTNSYACGITGRTMAGGTQTIKNCYNKGTITSLVGTSTGMTTSCLPVICNCINKGELSGIGLNAPNKPYGVAGLNTNENSQCICCISAGKLGFLSPPSTLRNSGLLVKGWGQTLTNCYYLNGIEGDTGITPEAGAIEFYKKGTDVLTSQDVVDNLNAYIDEHLEDEDTTTNTSDWLRWQVGSDGLPELIFD